MATHLDVRTEDERRVLRAAVHECVRRHQRALAVLRRQPPQHARLVRSQEVRLQLLALQEWRGVRQKLHRVAVDVGHVPVAGRRVERAHDGGGVLERRVVEV